MGQSRHWEQSMHSLEKQLFLVFFCHLTSSSWEGFRYALKHNLGGNILGLVSTTRLWGTDNLLVTLLNTTNKQYLPKRVVIIPLQQNISFFLGKLGMIDVKKMCWLQKFDVCDILSRVSTPFLRVNSQKTTQASQSWGISFRIAPWLRTGEYH